ncbi:uncharacterized protein LOC111712466 [Eurytemora carolleeae]|uniref:uncharacterized protein LOC111712466 n=1 Tax=Eurytemora carolleeae TaxID=1294199 RepID=UPI000C77CC4B|nr:uncharacterized protein LOC111712466 [Eurytemora carolleeae]|eukprot:XP_023342846.1 uncharacterized protein LOC111712466 [Eurytemora affinis]
MFFLNLLVGFLALGLVRGSVLQGSGVQTGCEGSLLMHSEEGEVYTLNMTTLQQDEKGVHQLKGGSLNVKHALRHGTCCYRLSSGRRRYKEVKMEGEHIVRMKIRKVELVSG